MAKTTGGTEPRKFSRLEDLLAAKDIDGLLVTTPDHHHSRHLVACLAARKHVYLEKPFANRLDEAILAIDAARASDCVVTIGTQRRSDPRYTVAAELMAKAPIGDIVGVEVVQNAHSPFRWRNATYVKAIQEKDTDWKAWLGGRPARPFDAHRYAEFRLYRDYSTGIIDQWMTHLVDTVHLLAGGSLPKSVVAHGGTYAWKDGRENGDTVNVALDYPEGFLVTYSSNLANASGSGCRILGRTGTLDYETKWRLSGDGVPGSKVEAVEIKPKEGTKGDMDSIHVANWIECATKGDKKTNCTPEHGYQHAVACIMADQALHAGRRVVYDAKARTIREG